jgi:MFS family permease
MDDKRQPGRATVIPPQLPEAAQASDGSVLRNTAFVRLWAAQLVSQTAQNGLMFALLVLITERTGSSLNASLLVLAFNLPSIVLSIPAGAMVDRWHKRTVLIVTNALRAAMAVLFILVDRWVPAVLLVTVCFSGVGQFFTPAEASTIPAIVPKRQLISANALFHLTLTGSQLMGLVILAPALLKIGGPAMFFGAMIVFYSLATLLVASLPRGFEPSLSAEPLRAAGMVRQVQRDVGAVLGAIRADRISLLALVQLTVSGTLPMLFGLLVPRYVRDVLDIEADNAVFVFAPLAVGAVIGLRLLRWITNRLPKQLVVTLALFGVAASLVALASVEFIGAALEQTRAREWVEAVGRYQPRFATFTLSILVLVTMACAIPAGFFYALVNAPAQTIIQERAPASMRGRYVGTQLLLASCTSLALVLLIGAAADAVGVTSVLLLFVPVVLAVAVYGLLSGVWQQT